MTYKRKTAALPRSFCLVFYNRVMFKIEPKTIEWLMAGDPCIRWQVQRDLLDKKPAVYEKERAKVAKEGWGAKYLALQDKEGRWGKGLYSPKWISTHYTMLTLRFLGLPAGNKQAAKGCAQLLEGRVSCGPRHPLRKRKLIPARGERRNLHHGHGLIHF